MMNHPNHIELTVCPEKEENFHHSDTPGHLWLHALHQQKRCSMHHMKEVNALLEYGDLIIAHLQADTMTNKEKALPSLTRHNLKKLSNWDTWDKAYDKQLDQHYEAGVFGKPVLRTSLPAAEQQRVLQMHWTNVVKADGRRKSCCCLDGSKQAAPWLRIETQTYSACIETPCMCLFLALAACQGMVINFGDTTNAFQQSPPPSKRCYVMIDEAYQSWHTKRFGSCPDAQQYVIPLLRNLQGHPEAGKCFKDLVNDILQSKMGFKSTTHERNLYHGTVSGKKVLICRQVDDFAVACTDFAVTRLVISHINKHITTNDMGMGIATSDGLFSRYNGLDVHQTDKYIKVSCTNYIDRMLQTHGWQVPGQHELDHTMVSPISPSACQLLQLKPGPMEGTKEYVALATKIGFSY